jgi:hypothetical protein
LPYFEVDLDQPSDRASADRSEPAGDVLFPVNPEDAGVNDAPPADADPGGDGLLGV